MRAAPGHEPFFDEAADSEGLATAIPARMAVSWSKIVSDAATLSHHANGEGVTHTVPSKLMLSRLESAQLSQSGLSKMLFSRADPNFSRH
jgi:hypothetical protein